MEDGGLFSMSEDEETSDKESDSVNLTDASVRSILMDQSSEKALQGLSELKKHQEQESTILESIVEVVKTTQRISKERLGHIRTQEKRIAALKNEVNSLEGILQDLTQQNRDLRTIISKDRFEKFGNAWNESSFTKQQLIDSKSDEVSVGDYENSLCQYNSPTTTRGKNFAIPSIDGFPGYRRSSSKHSRRSSESRVALKGEKKKNWSQKFKVPALSLFVIMFAIFIYQRNMELQIKFGH